jgi:hypothetical protein
MQAGIDAPGQAPLRQAMTALTRAATGNPQVPRQLQTVITHVDCAMTLGVPAAQLIAAADKAVALVGFDAADEKVEAASRRLEKATVEYRMWVLVRG